MKSIKINSCCECPYYNPGYVKGILSLKSTCEKLNGPSNMHPRRFYVIEDCNTIPGDCPLEEEDGDACDEWSYKLCFFETDEIVEMNIKGKEALVKGILSVLDVAGFVEE